MNTITKILVSATLALSALGAQAAANEDYPGDFAKGTNTVKMSGNLSTPSESLYDFRIETAAQKSPSRPVVEVRKEIVKARVITVDSIGA